MDNNEALNHILKEVDTATKAYERAYSDVQQTSSLAEKELKARFEQAETSAKAEAEQSWNETQQKIQEQFSNWNEKSLTSNLLSKAEQNFSKVTKKILLELLRE